MDTTQWAQGLGYMKMAMGEDQLLVPSSITPTTTTTNNATRAAVPTSQQLVERKARPQKELVLHCPRCNSTNTKFCYYNNYSLTQPRYFCKVCRRYWTQGGSIRNVPVGGGSRKNKRRSNPSPSTTSNIKNLPPQFPSSASLPTTTTTTTTTSQPFNQVHDLNLAYPNHNHNNFLNMEGNNINSIGSGSSGLSGMELLMPMHMPMASMPPPEESSGGTGMLHAAGLLEFEGNMQEGSRRLLFPFGDLKQEQHRGHGGEQPMFWNGMMGAGAGSW